MQREGGRRPTYCPPITLFNRANKIPLKITSMASDVNRQTVFKTTKVRTSLRNDGSWIRRSTNEQKDPQPCKSPVLDNLVPSVVSNPVPTSRSSTPKSTTTQSPTPPTPTSPGRRRRRGGSYVLSTLRKFETVESPESTPVKNNSNLSKSPEAALIPSTSQTDGVAKDLCSFCNKPVESTVKLSMNIPSITCHEGCLQCAMCAKPLGDLVSSMFHHQGKIHCEKCYNTVLSSM
ncbi:hypothetical protein AMELA_G00259100 [Ameiurus melas]|uniref:LIM zinc-binding domain-containing protein n=1 Tax=Ameiurus melas TaxID=219545 RepID=A0A7J5ZSN2_AMEME|nr:hypothetical protein AMELA_G00259100 [Ameiurus melas]